MVELIDAADYELKCEHKSEGGETSCGKPSRYIAKGTNVRGDDGNATIMFECPDKHRTFKQVPAVNESNIAAIKAKFADRESIVVWYSTNVIPATATTEPEIRRTLFAALGKMVPFTVQTCGGELFTGIVTGFDPASDIFTFEKVQRGPREQTAHLVREIRDVRRSQG